MTTIYDELRALFPDNEKVRACIRIAELGTPPALARAMCDEAKRLTPDGTWFWAEFSKTAVFEVAFFGALEQKIRAAQWLRTQREAHRSGGWDYPPTD